MSIFDVLSWADWLAVAGFFAGWSGYAWFARSWSHKRASLLVTTNNIRRQWIEQATARDPRMLDGLISQSLGQSPAFFASTSIIILGGLLAVLGTSEKASELVREIPFAARTSALVFEIKLLMVIGIFVHAFFRFTWSLRQYTFVSLLIGAMPPPADFAEGRATRASYVERASRQVGLAAETFNDGLRAYYFSFAAMGWFLSPTAMLLFTLAIIGVLYSREFRSEALDALKG